nr:MAG TPA: hypothetical protein [Caudoviricetes sp.]
MFASLLRLAFRIVMFIFVYLAFCILIIAKF